MHAFEGLKGECDNLEGGFDNLEPEFDSGGDFALENEQRQRRCREFNSTLQIIKSIPEH